MSLSFKVFSEKSWNVIQGDPNGRGKAIESGFIEYLMEDIEDLIDDDLNQLEGPEDANDSGVEIPPIKLQSPVEDNSLNWVSEILYRTMGDEEPMEDEVFILTLEKRFSCCLEACTEHVSWRARVKSIEDSKTIGNLEDGETLFALLDKWIAILKQKHFPSVVNLSLATTIFGRGSRPL